MQSNSRIETEEEVDDYITKMKYALDHGASINFQRKRKVDEEREYKYTNEYTVGNLFPSENPICALKRELNTLTVREYIETVKDINFPKRSEMRVFGKTYQGTEDIYIKIRVEIFNEAAAGNHTVFVMSFHYEAKPFTLTTFPYRK